MPYDPYAEAVLEAYDGVKRGGGKGAALGGKRTQKAGTNERAAGVTASGTAGKCRKGFVRAIWPGAGKWRLQGLMGRLCSVFDNSDYVR